jgi:periplasmic protein TonB
MNREQSAEDLDRKIGTALEKGKTQASDLDPDVRLVEELGLLPSDDFRHLLKAALLDQAEVLCRDSVSEFAVHDRLLNSADSVPTFSQREFAVLPADPRSLLLSFLSHATVVALIASGIWVGHETVIRHEPLTSELNYVTLPPGEKAPHGGGGGGDSSAVQTKRGTPPKFTPEQLAPPAIFVRRENPKLQIAPTVLGPPDLRLSQSNRLGDLFSSNTVVPSNGTGSRGGIGDNTGTGVGPGSGPGVGPGNRGGFGGEAYRPGNGVSAPRAIYDPDPEYSDEARKAKFQGNVVLSLIVDATGHVRDVYVARSLGMGLDEKAIEAVRKWKFLPGMKDGFPVAVQVDVEVSFRLY